MATFFHKLYLTKHTLNLLLLTFSIFHQNRVNTLGRILSNKIFYLFFFLFGVFHRTGAVGVGVHPGFFIGQDVHRFSGGHAGAAGVKLDGKNLYQFRTQINEYYLSLHLTDQEYHFKAHADLDLTDFSDLNLKFLEELQTLEPYGPGNETPVFRLKNTQFLRATRMGSDRNHLRLDLKDKTGKTLKCLAFFAPEKWLNLDPTIDHIEPLVQFVENDFNGVKSCETRIVDIDFA